MSIEIKKEFVGVVIIIAIRINEFRVEDIVIMIAIVIIVIVERIVIVIKINIMMIVALPTTR